MYMSMPHEKTLSLSRPDICNVGFLAYVFGDQTYVKRETYLVWLFVLKDN